MKIYKERLQLMIDDEWDSFLEEVYSFSKKHNIIVPNMDDLFIARGRSRQKAQEVTNMHYFRVKLLCSIIDMQLQVLNLCFTTGVK